MLNNPQRSKGNIALISLLNPFLPPSGSNGRCGGQGLVCMLLFRREFNWKAENAQNMKGSSVNASAFKWLALIVICLSCLSAWGQDTIPLPTSCNTQTPRQTLSTYFGYIKASGMEGHLDSAAQTFYVKDPSSEQVLRIATQLYEYVEAEGYLLELNDVPDSANLALTEYQPFPEEPDLFLVKRGKEWLWSRKTVKAIPLLHGSVFPQDEFGTGNSKFHFSLESPYHTIISHIWFLHHEDSTQYHPDSSAMALYVANPKSEESQTLAQQLLSFYDGQGYFIQPDYLPDDPDFLDSLTGKHIFHPIPEVDEVYVIKVGKKWVYSRRTVEAIPDLYAKTFPLGTLDWLPAWSKKGFLGLQVWQWLGLLAIALLVFVIHRVLTWLLSWILKILGQSVAHETIALGFLQKVARPISLMVISFTLTKVLPMLQLNISLSRWIMLTLRVATPIFAVLIFYFLVDMVAAYFARRAAKTASTLDDQLVPLLRKIMKGVVVIIGLVFILNQLNVNVTALVAGLSIGGLALALASQDTVKNFLGSLMIFLDRPFQVGDWIVADGNEGVVEEVSVRSTRIRTFANSLIYIPNAKLADTAVNNMGMRVYRRFNMKIALTYDTPPELIEAFVDGLKQLVLTHPFTRKDYYEVHFNDMNTYSLDVLFYVFFQVDTWTKELQGRHDLLMGIMRLAGELGVHFAFPTQTLQVENLPGQESLSPSYPNNRAESDRIAAAYLAKYKAEVSMRMKKRGHRMEEEAGNDEV